MPGENKLPDWVSATIKKDDKTLSLKLCPVRPGEAAAYNTAVIIEWRYGGDGAPPADVAALIGRFEQAIRGLFGSNGNSVLAAIASGCGAHEWTFYCADYDVFAKQMNDLLKGLPALPIKINYGPDPLWKYLSQYRDIVIATVKVKQLKGGKPAKSE